MKPRKNKDEEKSLPETRPDAAHEPVTLQKVPISEDEADLIIALRRKDEPGIPLEHVLAEYGLDD